MKKWSNWEDVEIYYNTTTTDKRCYLLQTRVREDGKRIFRSTLVVQDVGIGNKLNFEL